MYAMGSKSRMLEIAFKTAGASRFSSSGVSDDVKRMFNALSFGTPKVQAMFPPFCQFFACTRAIVGRQAELFLRVKNLGAFSADPT